jgi:phage terminase large subunit
LNISLPNAWTPRPYQRKLWNYLQAGGTRAVARWHRRSGKDDVFLHHTACSAHERTGNYWYMLPEYSQARKSMWEAINPHTGKRRIDEAFPHEIRATTREQEMSIVFHCGSTFQLVGSDNYNSLVGSPPIGLVFSEYALSDPSSWGYLMPILEENGGWVGFNSTPRGKNHFKNMCDFAAKEPGWFYEALRADQTGVFSPEALQKILRELQSLHGDEFGKALYNQEYFVSFDAAIPGSIWGDCIEKAEAERRITVVPLDKTFPVHTAFDLGRTDDTAIWFFQVTGGQVRIIDYHASNLKDITFYGDILRGSYQPSDSAEVRALKARTKTYTYGTHWLPHDARPRTLAAGGKSMLQQFNETKVGRFAIVPRLDKQEGIQAARATFPRCWFDAENCKDGLEALRQYHREWDAELKMFSDHPAHDWSSHGADAFRYLSLIWKNPKTKDAESTVEERMFKADIRARTFGDIRKDHFSRRRKERSEQLH